MSLDIWVVFPHRSNPSMTISLPTIAEGEGERGEREGRDEMGKASKKLQAGENGNESK